MNNRPMRINEEFMRCMSELIRNIKDPRVTNAGMMSITRCDVSGDLKTAKVYLSVFNKNFNKKELSKGLKSASGFLRRDIAHLLNLRNTPELVFIFDDSIEQGAKTLEILENL